MFHKFRCWGQCCKGCAVAVVCLLGFNTASGDVMCEDDEENGLCLYEGWFYRVEIIPTTVEDISCRWVVVEDEARFVCVTVNYTSVLLGARFYPFTFIVHAETEAQRMTRIAFAVDNWIVETVTRWAEECDSFLEGGPVVVGYDPAKANGEYEFTATECRELIEVYEAGFADPVHGSHLTGYHVLDDLDERAGEFKPDGNESGKGAIFINIGKIEVYQKPKNWEAKTREVVAHERVHLADWTDSHFHWVYIDSEGNPSQYLHDLLQNDKTYRWGRFIGERAGPITPAVDWSRTCLDHQVSYYLAGWGHHNQVREGYCFVKMVLRAR